MSAGRTGIMPMFRWRIASTALAYAALLHLYGLAAALGEAEAAGLGVIVADASVLGAVFFSCWAFSASVIGPSFTVFPSNVPSVSFQYEPRTSSLTATSFIVAVAPALVSLVLSVIFKKRECSLPAIVKVFAF